MNVKRFTLAAIVLLAMLLAACVGTPVEECFTSDSGTQYCVSVNPASTEPTATPAPAAPPTAASAEPQVSVTDKCVADKDYQLQDLPEVSTSGSFLNVEFWEEGSPERETILPTGRYELTRPLKGHVWEYSSGCTETDVKALVNEHIERRIADGANNAGWADQKLVEELFQPVR